MKPVRLLFGFMFAAIGGGLAWKAGLSWPITATIAVTVLTASWWVSEAMPIPAASLAPFAFLPLSGVITHREAAAALGSHVIILLMASFMLSKALERSGAHERLALSMIRLTGETSRGLIFGFMLAAALLSMWISNTATTLMLATMALAIISRMGDGTQEAKRLGVPLLLGIAYAASFGGTATLIGTPPNLIFADAYQRATGDEYGFVRFMQIGLPSVLVGVPIMALWLTRRAGGLSLPVLPDQGPWRSAEVRTLVVFGIAILLWVTRGEPLGGWSGLIGVSGVGDSTVGVFAVVLMFLVPRGDGQGALLDWETASDIPWGMLLLFAGGICIATAFRESGLADLVGEALAGFASAPPLLMLMALCLSVSFLTEVTSNTATANLLMPVLAAVALEAEISPALIMIPAVISCSCAFMLPVATAPNAIVYGTGRLSIAEMAREGVVLNIIMAMLVAVTGWLLLGSR